MADAIYDVVIVGGGHHATIMACYLADAGLSVAMFERSREMGGGACGEDLPLPGFIQNPCANYTRFWAHPSYEKFKLREHGLHYVFPEQKEGIVFDDDTCLIGYPALRMKNPDTLEQEFCVENWEKTLREIERFSKRDAQTASELFRHYREKWRDVYGSHGFSPPTPWGEPDPLEMLTKDPKNGIPPEYQYWTGRQIAYDLFESPELRTFFMRSGLSTTGCFPGDVFGLYNFIRTLPVVFAWEPSSVLYGGTHSITHALQRAYSSMGGQFFVMKEVDKVLIENGRAVGVKLADGTEVKARKFVVSDCGAPQTILRLIGEDKVPEQIARRVKNIDYDRSQIFWGNVAMHELPKYTAQQFNPDCGMQPLLYFCPKDPNFFAEHYQHQLYTRGWPDKAYIFTGPNCIWDPTRAPDGKYTVLVEEFTAPLRYFSEDEWLKMKKESVWRIVDEWRKYAPNMTRDNIIGAHLMSPYDVSKRHPDMHEGGWSEGSMFAGQMNRMRPIPELSGYRTPVKDLYICSSNMHPGGGIGRGSSICCYKVIAEDHGLPALEGV